MNLRRRFATVLEPQTTNFNPVPAAACLLDPTVATVLHQPEACTLLRAAKFYINGQEQPTAAAATGEVGSASLKSGWGKFKYLSKQIKTTKVDSFPDS